LAPSKGLAIRYRSLKPQTSVEGPGSRLIAAIICAIPVMILGMLHANPWVQLALTLPVIVYSGGADLPCSLDRPATHRSAKHEHAHRAWVPARRFSTLSRRDAPERPPSLLRGHSRDRRANPPGTNTRGPRARAAPRRPSARLMDLQPPIASVIRKRARIADACGGGALRRYRSREARRTHPCRWRCRRGRIRRRRINAHRREHARGEARRERCLPPARSTGPAVSGIKATRIGRGNRLASNGRDGKAGAGLARAPVARLADVVSGYFTLAVLLVAAVTFAVWLFFFSRPSPRPW